MRTAEYLCVHVPEFPAQALLRLRPELANVAVAVVEGLPPLEQVCSATGHARQLGVVHGMTRSELGVFRALQVLRRSEPEEELARRVLVETAGGFTPRTEVWPTEFSTFVMVLDITGTSRIFGPSAQLAMRIQRALQQLRIRARIAVSANFHAAVCMAAASADVPRVIPLSMEAQCLARLPLTALKLTAQQADTLASWGLNTLGELAALPEVELVVRLGAAGRSLRLLARGEHPHLMVPVEAAFELKEFVAFDAPVEMLDSLFFVLCPMLDQLLQRAQNRALSLASVTIRLGLDGGGEHERTIKLALPTARRDVLLKLLQLDLQAHPPAAGVVSLAVHAEPGKQSDVQLGLFAPQLPEPARLEVTIARIAALVGEGRVGQARLLDSHRPESFTVDKFAVTRKREKHDGRRSQAVALRRCRPPLPVIMMQEGLRLSTFTMQGKRYAVREAYGPWRKSGLWWSPEVWSIDEWDVSAEGDAGDLLLCLITHNLLGQSWQIEALYD